MQYSFNYLVQLYVCIEDYDSAIDTYLKYISTNNFYEGDEYLYVCADFLYRIGIIYNRYLKDLETSRTYMEHSFNTLEKINNKDDDIIDFMNTINKYLFKK